MASDGMCIIIDTSEINDTIAEIAALYGDGSDVPANIAGRVSDMLTGEPKYIADIQADGGTLIAKPSPALSALARDLWALRGYGVADFSEL